MTKLIEILHADHFGANGPSGFERVRFPALVRADAYRYETNPERTLDTLMLVPNAELVRIGYTGPLLDCGSLSFGTHNRAWRDVTPFTYWNQLKASRPVGPIGQPVA